MKLLMVWCVLAVQVLAAGEGPETPAVRYLERIRDGAVNLEPGGDTAMATQTVEEKRAGIAQRIKRLSADLGKLPLVAGSSRVDGDLAAVLVGQGGGYDFDSYQVTAVALVKRGESWLPAPLPGSYQNAGLSYEPAVRQRAKRLEDWMVEQKGVELERLRSREVAKLRRQIEEALPLAEWKAMGPSQCAERFFKACESGELTVLAGLLGGSASPLPDDWGQSWKVAGQALASSDKVPRQWRLMMAPEVLRIPMAGEVSADLARIPVACLDPAGVPPKFQKTQMEQVSLELVRSADGLWRVSPPRAILPSAGEAGEPEAVSHTTVDGLRESVALRFPAAAQTDSREAVAALVSAFHSRSPSRWAALIRPREDGDSLRGSLESGASIWRAFSYPASSRHAVLLGDHGDSHHRAFVFQVFSALAPDRLELRDVHFVKSGGGWFWEPRPADGEPAGFDAWRDGHEREWQGSWRSVLLKGCVALDGLEGGKPPSAEEARMTVDRWYRLVGEGDVAGAVGLTTRLRLPDSEATMMRNLGYEMNAARNRSSVPVAGDVLLAAPWSLVAVKPAPDAAPGFACLPVVQTAGGPRILLETDLVVSGSRARKYLNSEALSRLAKVDAEAARVLNDLLAKAGKDSHGPTGN